MQETIDRLREQPREHRTAIAASIAIAVVALLLVGWFFFFMHDLNKGNLEYARPPAPESEAESLPSSAPVYSADPVSTSTATTTIF
ncbi:hypothetical protein C4568_02010 [Candidatus Parcubacteria bacterium]|nr:MAG: hypothetical protein C4568_02010 [Candidatus Parcubacteria bacterium]